jgi:hypothetical protein
MIGAEYGKLAPMGLAATLSGSNSIFLPSIEEFFPGSRQVETSAIYRGDFRFFGFTNTS